ncbi:MAG TPA: serine/threonine protein kinase, partial [Pirellulaceae bacterium]
WLTNLFRRGVSGAAAAQAHITFGSTSAGRSISRTGLFLKKQLWIWPIIAIVLLGFVGFGIRIAIERTMKASLRSELETLLSIERSMVETWLHTQEQNAESLANDQHVREIFAELLAASQPIETGDSEPAEKRPSLAALNRRLAQELSPGLSSHDFVSYFVANRQQKVLASANPELIGEFIPQHEAFLTRVFSGESTVCPPFPSVVSMKDEFGRVRTGVPTMYAAAPIRDANFQIVGALALRIRPEKEFTRILQLGQVGKSGETFAIDKNGTFVTNSRFDDKLIDIGLLPDTDGSHSILQLQARDPGGDLVRGFRTSVRRSKLPLTKDAAAAIAGTSGVDVDGYRDYRGVRSVGAWEWLPRYDMGIVTELDYAEAFGPLTILQWAFFSMFTLLTASSLAIFVFTLVVARLEREAQKAAIEAKHLGQYRLEQRLGAGAMGVVYKGHHAMLRRATAIKMLNVDMVNDLSIARFEREVQVTCQLNNPSTVAIYDYGRTPEGVFYYAMEYLDGLDLQQLVDRYGPQPEGRVIHILQSICSSLGEAHMLGLVHRDIKPANVMLNHRGGQADVVKVLDFGLVRAIDESRQSQQSGGMAGTPLYMSPEAIQTPDAVDARSDLYAVGAIGYFLLTGQPVFNAATLIELCKQHLAGIPDSPSMRIGRAISPELESAILLCFEKNRAKRPQTARDLANLLDRAPTARSWTHDEADTWWLNHDRAVATAGTPTVAATAFSAGPHSPHPTPGQTIAATNPIATTSNTSQMGAAGRTAPAGLDQTIATDTKAS